jgi:hypothetical protein
VAKSCRICQTKLSLGEACEVEKEDLYCLQEVQQEVQQEASPFQLKNNISQKILDARETIASGSLILRVDRGRGSIALENKLKCNVYWTCPGLLTQQELENSRFICKRLESGHSALIYELDKIALMSDRKQQKKIFNSNDELFEAHVVNLSLGKRWGLATSRTSIEKCPCWINISVSFNYFSN